MTHICWYLQAFVVFVREHSHQNNDECGEKRQRATLLQEYAMHSFTLIKGFAPEFEAVFYDTIASSFEANEFG